MSKPQGRLCQPPAEAVANGRRKTPQAATLAHKIGRRERREDGQGTKRSRKPFGELPKFRARRLKQSLARVRVAAVMRAVD